MRRELTGQAAHRFRDPVPLQPLDPRASPRPKDERSSKSGSAVSDRTGSGVLSRATPGSVTPANRRRQEPKTVKRFVSLNFSNEFSVKPVAYQNEDPGQRVGGYRFGEPLGWELKKKPGLTREHSMAYDVTSQASANQSTVNIVATYAIPEVATLNVLEKRKDPDICYDAHIATAADYVKQIREGMRHIKANTPNLGFSVGDRCDARLNVSHKPELDWSELVKVARAFVYFECAFKSLYFPRDPLGSTDHAFKGEAPAETPPNLCLCSAAETALVLDDSKINEKAIRNWYRQGSRRLGRFGFVTGDSTSTAHLYFTRPGAYGNGDDILDWIKLVLSFIEAALSFQGGLSNLRRYPANRMGLGEFLAQRGPLTVSSVTTKGQDRSRPTSEEVRVEMHAAAFPSVMNRGPPGGGVVSEGNDRDIQRMWDRAQLG